MEANFKIIHQEDGSIVLFFDISSEKKTIKFVLNKEDIPVFIEKLLGKHGLGVIRKTFGVVLLAIAVKLFAANVKGLFV